MDQSAFFAYLKEADRRVVDYLRGHSVRKRLQQAPELGEGAWAYVGRKAKRLRPAVLLMSAGCLGGAKREQQAVPAASGVELFHTWTLVHDDLIDHDEKRRGEPTVHVAAARSARKKLGMSQADASEFGRDIAILAGDMQHGWCIDCFTGCALDNGVSQGLVLQIIRCLQSYVLANIMCGQTLDVRYGMTRAATTQDLSEEAIEKVLWLKTGVLYEFAGWAGAVIGSNTFVPITRQRSSSSKERAVLAVKAFTGHCGIAFQLQDDILGIVGREKELGKQVGSDIREGKQTVIVRESLKNATRLQKARILSVLGNEDACDADVEEVSSLFRELGGIARADSRARGYIRKAKRQLKHIPDGRYKSLLESWSDFMIDREF